MRLLWLIVFFLVGCSGTARIKYANPDSGERIVVTAGYELNQKTVRVGGDEFVFSFVPPAEVAWRYVYSSSLGWFRGDWYPTEAGYITLTSRDGRYPELNISWGWIPSASIKLLSTDSRGDGRLMNRPWLTGVKGDLGRRIYYAPDARSLRYGDWSRMGYTQHFFSDVIQRGAKQYYCFRTVSNRSGALAWNTEVGVAKILPKDAVWLVMYSCPFRTLDGRDGYWNMGTSVPISGRDIAAGRAPHEVLDERLAVLDSWLEPIWQSLVITPLAYQFDPPAGAKQSVYCKSDGLCWNDMEKD